jgi:hypothetical protein
LLTIFAAILSTSTVATLVWHWAFNTTTPTLLLGVVGGITAAATWEFLKRVATKP